MALDVLKAYRPTTLGWLCFVYAILITIGPKPPRLPNGQAHSLDRVDNNAGYWFHSDTAECNVRWSTPLVQTRNRSLSLRSRTTSQRALDEEVSSLLRLLSRNAHRIPRKQRVATIKAAKRAQKILRLTTTHDHTQEPKLPGTARSDLPLGHGVPELLRAISRPPSLPLRLFELNSLLANPSTAKRILHTLQTRPHHVLAALGTDLP